jgi:GLPGLI family protein
MKNILVLFALIYMVKPTTAQTRIVAECTVHYSIAINDAVKADNETIALLKSSSKTVYIKGNDSRVDLTSPSFSQTMIYNKSTGTAVILREMGSNKFITKLDEKKWIEQNSKYSNLNILYTSETKKILGYDCKKAILQLQNGNSFTVYYAPNIIPSVTEFEYQFKNIPGFVLEYETREGDKQNIVYTATKISFNPVQAAKFDIPTSGYRMLN